MVSFVRDGFFSAPLSESDTAVYSIIVEELSRQQHQLELIASENIVSKAVLDAVGSILTNKYAEGYPGKRYYGGCVHVDALETLAIERATKLFHCQFANVQPHSGSSANIAVYFALLSAGDTVLGMDLNAGGHLTHGASVSFSGKIFHGVSYGVDPETFLIDYDAVEALAHEHRPKMIIAGWSSYSRPIDFARFRAIADSVGAFLMVDMAHFAGLVVAGLYPSPFPHAHVVTSTTHKTLRGPRGGLILTDDATISKRINSAIFPMAQGGPLMHVIAGKAVAFAEAMDPSYTAYMKQVVQNARILSSTLMDRGLSVLTGGTDTHLLLLNLKSLGITGLAAEHALEAAGLTTNKNSIPFDDAKPTITSGVRLGTPAITTRGFKDSQCVLLAHGIADVLHSLVEHPSGDPVIIERVRSMVVDLCRQFPIYDKTS